MKNKRRVGVLERGKKDTSGLVGLCFTMDEEEEIQVCVNEVKQMKLNCNKCNIFLFLYFNADVNNLL